MPRLAANRRRLSRETPEIIYTDAADRAAMELMMTSTFSAAAALALSFFAVPALAQMSHDAHADAAAPAAAAPYAEDWARSAERMHEEMSAPLTGDADVDFARGMIPHHRAAIDMARIQIEHGSDPELRKVAEAVIATQEAEIALLEAWLAQRGQ